MNAARAPARTDRADASQLPYQAFLSYSHAADGHLAAFLQESLQRFAKPWYRRRAIRVFRDTTGLALTPDLWESIRAALHASEYFILFASERAAQSRWIELELDEWLRTGSADRLLIVLTDGELVWNSDANDFDWSKTTSLHHRLRGVFHAEPLHLDLRWARTAEDLSPRRPELLDAVARISATLRQVPLDDLFGEDVRQHRRTRRLAVSAVTTLLGLLIASILAARFAVSQRNSAQRRLVELTVANGARAIEDGDLSASALWFAQALRLDDGRRDEADLHRIRLRTAVQQHPALLHLWSADSSTVRWAAFGSDGHYVISSALLVDYRWANGQFEGIPLPGAAPVVWDTRSGDALHFKTRTGAQGRVLAVDAADERVLGIVASGDGDVSIADLGRGVELARLEHPAAATAASFSSDGATVITECDDHSVRLWSAPDGRLLRVIEHETPLSGAAFTRAGTRLLTITADGVAHIWTVSDANSHAHESIVQDEAVDQVDVSSDGRYALTIASRTARLWDLEAEDQPMLVESWIGVNHGEFSPNGATLLLADDFGEASLFTLDPLRLYAVVRHGGLVLHATFSPDGRWFATASTDRIARVWNTDGEPVSPQLHHEGTVSHVAFDAERRRLVTTTANDIVRVWQLEAAPAPLQHEQVDRVTFRRDGGRILTTGTWDVKSWELSGSPVTISPGSQVYHADFSPDGRLVVTGTEDAAARLWDAATGAELLSLSHNRAVTDARFSPDGSRLATVAMVAGNRAEVVVWNPSSGEKLFGLAHGEGIPSNLEFSSDGATILALGLHGLTVWDLASRRELKGLDVDDVTSASFSPDGKLLVIVQNRSTAHLYDVRREQLLDRAFKHENFMLGHVAFGADAGTLLMVGGGYARAWDVGSGVPRTPPLTHGTRVNVSRITASADGRYLATLASDGTVRLWNARTGQLLSPSLRHGRDVRDAAFNTDASRLVTVGDGMVRVWHLSEPQSKERDERLTVIARLLAARDIDATGAVIPLDATELQRSWANARGSAIVDH